MSTLSFLTIITLELAGCSFCLIEMCGPFDTGCRLILALQIGVFGGLPAAGSYAADAGRADSSDHDAREQQR